MEKVRVKSEPIKAFQRPGGYPHDDVVLAFIKEVTEAGGAIAVVPRTNFMFLLDWPLDARMEGEAPNHVRLIQPGQWLILQEGGGFYICNNDEFVEHFEPFDGAS